MLLNFMWLGGLQREGRGEDLRDLGQRRDSWWRTLLTGGWGDASERAGVPAPHGPAIAGIYSGLYHVIYSGIDL
jgi:hypothetical protein